MKRIIPFVLLTLAGSVNAKDIYVSKSGADTNDGLTQATSVSSLWVATQKAVDGDVIHLRPGIYTASTTINKNVTIQGENAATTILQAGENKSGGGNLAKSKYVIALGGTASVTMKNLTLRHGYNLEAGGAIGVYANQSLRLESCNVIDNYTGANGGAIANWGNLEVVGCYIANNVSKLNGGGIAALGGTLDVKNTVIYNNKAIAVESADSKVREKNGSGAVHITGSTSNKFYNNTIAHNTAVNSNNYGIRVEGTDNTGRLELYNNIFSNSPENKYTAVDITYNMQNALAPADAQNKHNLFSYTYNALLSTTTIPAMADKQTSLVFPTVAQIAFEEAKEGVNGVWYLPIASSSVAKDAADPTTTLATDMFGNAREGVADLGAYEFTASTGTSTPEVDMAHDVVCPSMSNGTFQVDNTGDVELVMSVFNMSGQRVAEHVIPVGNSTVQLSKMQGMYLMSFASDKNHFSVKHIVSQ